MSTILSNLGQVVNANTAAEGFVRADSGGAGGAWQAWRTFYGKCYVLILRIHTSGHSGTKPLFCLCHTRVGTRLLPRVCLFPLLHGHTLSKVLQEKKTNEAVRYVPLLCVPHKGLQARSFRAVRQREECTTDDTARSIQSSLMKTTKKEKNSCLLYTSPSPRD